MKIVKKRGNNINNLTRVPVPLKRDGAGSNSAGIYLQNLTYGVK